MRCARGLAGRLLCLALAPGEPAIRRQSQARRRHQAGPSRHLRTLWQPAHPCRAEGPGPRREPWPHRAIDAPSRYQGHYGEATAGRTTDSRHDLPIAPNLLDRNFTAAAPNRIWLADITYVETDQGWLYLATVLDLYSRSIVGWAMQDHLRAELPLAALRMAISAKRPGPGLVHHSDRGVQYASEDYRKLMQSAGFKASMSRKGDCYDNAPMESFFHTLKTELVHHRQYPTRAEATRDIFAYIEGFYNRTRRHSAIGYITPIEMELKAA